MSVLMIAAAAMSFGAWNVEFDETSAQLKIANPSAKVELAGELSFESKGQKWKVRESLEQFNRRLTLCKEATWNSISAVRGYVSFRDTGDRLSIEGVHRTGRTYFPGTLVWKGVATVRPDAFACRTIPAEGETVLNFSDGGGDLPTNDSAFSPEEDFALRLFSKATRVTTLGGGRFGFELVLTMDDSANSTITVEADRAYYKSRWCPGYTPVNRKRTPRAPTGWLSWNTYFDKAGAKENLFEAGIAKKFLQPFGLEFIQIESWQANSYWLPVSNFHNLDLSCCPEQFPEGMKKLADDIKALGFRPGMWMPLYGTGNDAIYAAHRDWFLHDKDGKPIQSWNGKYTLDYTVPAVHEHIRKITRIASREWGYEFFKFDGMAQKSMEAPAIRACAKNPKSRDWFVDSVKSMRAGIGEDRVMLGSMADFTGAEVGILDASRLGADIASLYDGVVEQDYLGRKSFHRQAPIRWHNVMDQVECTYGEVFVNNIMMFIDPDTLLVNYALDKNEAEVMATVVGLAGQVTFAGDKLAELGKDRMKILQQVLPVADIRPVGLYPYFNHIPVWNLQVKRPFGKWNNVALFNFSNSDKKIETDFAALGLDAAKKYAAYEFWCQNWMGLREKGLSLTVPAHTVRLISLREAQPHPQFVGDDRHLTQGAVELQDERWDEVGRRLSVRLTAVGGFPLTFAVSVPDGFAVKSVKASGDAKVKSQTADGLMRVTILSQKTADIDIAVGF